MSNYEAPKIYQVLKDINSANIVASTKPSALHSSLVEGATKYHHNMGFPCSEKEKGVFNLVFPQMITSPINETTQKNDGVTKGFPVFGKVYGNYHEMVSSVNRIIDTIIAESGLKIDKASPQELEKLFKDSLQKRGRDLSFLEQEFQENVTDTSSVFGEELFRHLLLKILIEDEKVKDVKGYGLERAMIQLKKCYCDSMDSPENFELKKTILLGIGISAKELKTPTDKLVEDILEYEDYPTTDPKLAGLVNYTKSPQIHFKLMVSIPKADAPKKSPIVVSTTGQILWTSVYDYLNNPLGKTPITTYEQFNRFLYRAGDTKKGKNMFELLQSITTSAPSVYWEKGSKAIIQFKAVVLKIFDLYEIAGFTKTISNEEYQNDLQEAREAMSYYKRESKPQVVVVETLPNDDEFQTSSNGELRRDRDSSDQDFNQDLNAMIDEGYDLQESSYKKKKS